MRRAKPATRRASVARAGAPLDAAAAAAIEAWASTKVLDHAQLAFCRQAVGGISPPSAHAARVYLTALASLVVDDQGFSRSAINRIRGDLTR